MKTKFYYRFAMVFTTILMFTFIAASQTTITVTVSDPLDDTEEVAEEGSSDALGTMDSGSSDLEFIQDDGYLQYVGLIFRNVLIPPGVTISNAYIQFTSDKALSGVPVTCKLFGGAVANMAAPFAEELFSISSHAQTVATVSWTVPPFGDLGVATEAERSPDISAIIQEIIGISGWASGNNMMIGVKNDADTKANNREAVSYDGNPLYAPVLNVTYNEGAVGINPDRAEFSRSIYPNPTLGMFQIKNPSSDPFSYEIYTISGKMVASRDNISGPAVNVDLSGFAKGMYFVGVRTAERTETHKLILK